VNNILFITPTIMGRPELEIAMVENIAKLFPECKVLFVANVEDNLFEEYKPKYDNIIKTISGEKYNVSKALNKGLDYLTNEDYVCFVQSDMFVSELTIQMCKSIVDDEEFNSGIVGIRPHSIFHLYNKLVATIEGLDVYRVLWSDGIMFWSKKVLQDVGRFNEDYLGDRESQEYCYRAHEKGYNNYYLAVDDDGKYSQHFVTTISSKDRHDNDAFLKVYYETRDKFKSKYEGWEPTQKHLFE
tara:strand:- start:1638 stop:2363 length:726 start_codon:yes stop_codon:yes gene_type:complete